MSNLTKCPFCQTGNFIDISDTYTGWEEHGNQLLRCSNCFKCWCVGENGISDFTEKAEKASGDALTEALDKFLNSD